MLICLNTLAPKTFTTWKNNGPCVATGKDLTCGPGNQMQKRTCKDGFPDVCNPIKDPTERIISCAEAGTALPYCDKGTNITTGK